MLKNLCLSVAFMVLPFSTLIPSDRTIVIQSSLEHISQQISAIMLEVKVGLILKNRTEKHFQELLQDTYESTKNRCWVVLATILLSDEFSSTIEQVTTEQARLIVDENISFDDIIIDPSAFPLEQKIKTELSNASFDEQTEQLFNIFYVAYAITRGSRLLIEKLEVKKSELAAELENIQRENQAALV